MRAIIRSLCVVGLCASVFLPLGKGGAVLGWCIRLECNLFIWKPFFNFAWQSAMDAMQAVGTPLPPPSPHNHCHYYYYQARGNANDNGSTNLFHLLQFEWFDDIKIYIFSPPFTSSFPFFSSILENALFQFFFLYFCRRIDAVACKLMIFRCAAAARCLAFSRHLYTSH